MKKYVSCILLLVLFFTYSVSQAATVRSSFVCNDSLITDVSFVGAQQIEFYGLDASGGPVSYEIYYYHGSKPDNRTLLSNPVSSGTINSSKAVYVTLHMPGCYYIRSYNGYQYDNDYVIVPMTEETYSESFVWNNETIDRFKKNQLISKTIDTVTGLVLSLTITGKMGMVITVGTAIINELDGVKVYLQDFDIRTNPQEGWSWQYKFVPTQKGYDVYLLTYDQYNNLNSNTKVASYTY